jgi:hypothetical protein
VPHVCKKIARMPNMNSISSKAMLVKMLAEKNRYMKTAVLNFLPLIHYLMRLFGKTTIGLFS